MNNIYVVWSVFWAAHPDGPDTPMLNHSGDGLLCGDEEHAVAAANSRFFKSADERVLLIRLQPWAAPELIKVLGEFSGSEALNFWQLERNIRGAMTKAFEWATSQFELTRIVKESV